MADMLVELIQKFIDGSEATLNSLFKSMVNLVFFIERENKFISLSVNLCVSHFFFEVLGLQR